MTRSMRLSLCFLLGCLLAPRLCYADPHPTRLYEHANCLECHADHASGEHVHSALKWGCNSCHMVVQRDDVTYVELKPTKSVICYECHQPAALQYPHFPYASGMCTRCHNPHSSANPWLLRAKVNDLCLSCHLYTPGSVPTHYLPKIELTLNDSAGHPTARHPVSGFSDPLRGGELSCISCHLAHGGTKLHHLRMGSEIPEDALNQNTETRDMCEKCHMRLWGLDGVSGKKKKKK